MTMSRQDHSRLVEIRAEMLELVEETKGLIQGTRAWEGAKGYWFAHLTMALRTDNCYVGGSAVTMEDTIAELDPYDDEKVSDEDSSD